MITIKLCSPTIADTSSGFDGGNVPFSTTRVSTLATALVNLVRNPEATKNGVLYIHDTITTQNELLACAQTLDNRLIFSDAGIDTQALEREAWTHYENSQIDPLHWVFSFINISIWSREELCAFPSNHNGLLGIEELQGSKREAVLETELAKAISVFADFSASTTDAADCRAAETAMEVGKSKLSDFVRAT